MRPSSSRRLHGVIVAAVVSGVLQGTPAEAQERAASVADTAYEQALASEVAQVPATRRPSIARAIPRAEPERPAALFPLYVSFAALQMLDGHSTTRALGSGAAEGNALMSGIAGNPTALFAVKAATAAGTIYIAEQLWKRNRMASIVTMIALNSAFAMVVKHNYAVGGR